jgi:hypothetical protein
MTCGHYMHVGDMLCGKPATHRHRARLLGGDEVVAMMPVCTEHACERCRPLPLPGEEGSKR